MAIMSIADIASEDFDLIETIDFLKPAPVVERVVQTQSPYLGPHRNQLLDEMGSNEAVCPSHEHARLAEFVHKRFLATNAFTKAPVVPLYCRTELSVASLRKAYRPLVMGDEHRRELAALPPISAAAGILQRTITAILG
jgi:hypothetical protein